MKILKLPTTLPDFLTWWEELAGRAATESEGEGAEYIVWLLNSAYIDGFNMREGYPENPETEIAAYATEHGEEPTYKAKEAIIRITRWRNRAYQEGRRVAEKEAEA